MKLLTHNLLTSCALKSVKEGFPLRILADEVRTVELDFNPEFITRLMGKLNWKALIYGAKCIGHEEDVPENLPSDFENNEELLKKIHHILFEVEIISGSLECPETKRKFPITNGLLIWKLVEVISGSLECPETKRKFPITNGIPNMLLNEDEV